MVVECAYEHCHNTFDTGGKHGRKYCSPECSTKANNAKILKKYHERKARLKGGRRVCKMPGCLTPLSKYNDMDICNACYMKEQEDKRSKLLKELGK